ncbi:hypothetical protein [Nonomuraea longicatena]|uniref:Uncharacterized protein n=1 Tax=Nonomuraea longicatena TaxID=83682 RepID=A0ABP4AUZ2_9ACTN
MRRQASAEARESGMSLEEVAGRPLRASYSAEDPPVHVLETVCAANRHVFPIGQVAGHDEF